VRTAKAAQTTAPDAAAKISRATQIAGACSDPSYQPASGQACDRDEATVVQKQRRDADQTDPPELISATITVLSM
jgi:hypothetical protein